jgi:mevalonate kinase
MPAISAAAPGKAILFGEHAVVYERPAIAVPVSQVQARVNILADPVGPQGRVMIDAPDVGLRSDLALLPDDSPFRLLVRLLLEKLGISHLPALKIGIHSTIPVAAGLGSGTAVSVAALRALSVFVGHPLNDEQVCELAFQVEKAYHGTPSGIDNTVITYARPIYFIKGQPFELLHVSQPLTLVIGDSGVSSPTALAVGGVRARWQANSPVYEALFDRIAEISHSARSIFSSGTPERLGTLMDENHAALQEMGVSSPELDTLVLTARNAGAWGAKISGGGQGGNMIALVEPQSAEAVAQALRQAHATRTIITTVAGDAA